MFFSHWPLIRTVCDIQTHRGLEDISLEINPAEVQQEVIEEFGGRGLY